MILTCIASGAAGVDCNIKLGAGPTHSRWKMDAIHVAVESLAENDPVEWLVKFNGNLHQVLLALDIKGCDFRHIRLGLWPGIVRFARFHVCVNCYYIAATSIDMR